MAEVVSIHPSIDHDNGSAIDSFVMSAFGNFVVEREEKPSGCVVILFDSSGEAIISHFEAARQELAYAAAHLLRLSPE